MAVSVVVAVGDVGDPLVAAIKERLPRIKVGPGSDAASEMGPLVTREHRDKVASYLDKAADAGATVVTDGREAPIYGEDGFFLGVSLIDNVQPDHESYRNEIFGPVLEVMRVATYDDAVKLVNDNPYGNGTAIFTRDGGAARQFQFEVAGGHGRHQRAHTRAGRVLQLRWLEGLALRRREHVRPGGHPVLHALEGRHRALARPRHVQGRPRLSAHSLTVRRSSAVETASGLTHSPGTALSMSYRPGPMSRLITWLDGTPGRGLWMVILLAVVLLAWGNGFLWATGQLPVGTFDSGVAVLVAYGPYVLAAMLLARYVALRALDTFWPATGWPQTDRPAWAYQFMNTPAWIELVALALGFVVALAALIAAPTTVVVSASTVTVDYYLAIAPIFVVGYTLTIVAVFIATRWLLLVMRIHREARAIDPFDRAPVYAFSRLTVVIGMVAVIAAYYTFTLNAAYQVGNVPSLALMAASVAGGLGAFVIPLWGIHVRIARERDALIRDVERRINRIATELYADIDAGSFEAATKYSALLTTLGNLRERVGHLPTWPWPPNLFRGFITALLLPILIFFLTKVISTYLS